MLEQKEIYGDEKRKYLDYEANLIFKYEMIFIVATTEIRMHGLSVFLRQEDCPNFKSTFSNASIEEIMEINSLIEHNPASPNNKLAKKAFKVSEYYPGFK